MRILLLALALASMTPQAKALELVKAQLKDPDSAKFKGVKPMGDKGGYCGWVNAKNGYGGYIGFSVFFVNHDGNVSILTPELSDPRLC